MRTTTKLLLMIGSAVATFLPAIPAADAAAPQQATIANFSFSPNPVKIPLGATVEWTNTDGTAHTVTADDGSFGSDHLVKGATFSHTFDQPGAIAYHCAIHTSMRGTVQVEAPPTTAAPTTTTTAAATTSTTAAPTTTSTASGSPPTAGLVSPKPASAKPAVSSTTGATAAPTTATTAPTTSTTAPSTTTTTLPEQTPSTQGAIAAPSGGSGNGGAVGVGVAIAAVLLLGGGAWWVWRRRLSAA